MYTDLNNKVAVVTGGSKGIGRGIAVRFGLEGMKVVVNYHHDAADGDETVEIIRRAGGEAVAVKADVAKEKDNRSLLETALETFGTLDVWVNNAGIQSMFPSHKLSLEEWNRVISVNLDGTFLGCREAIHYMLEHHISGNVINISSVHQQIPKPQHVHYAASKGGMKLMTETLALEYASKGIRINGIAPGAIRTPMNGDILKVPGTKKKVLSLIPMQEVGEPEHVAAAAAWLASRESAYVTGITLFVDGGMTLYGNQA